LFTLAERYLQSRLGPDALLTGHATGVRCGIPALFKAEGGKYMKIAVFEVEDWERESLERLGDKHDLSITEDTLNQENADTYADAEIISSFIYSDLNEKILSRFKGLKMIATRSTGYSHIDTGYCESKNIAISNAPDYAQHTVAEHVFGLLLTISHNITKAVERTSRGDFSFKGLEGFDLKGKTIGVIGTGDIGINVIRIARGFGMDVLAFDVKAEKNLESEFGFRYVPMDELLSSSDIITIHVPGNEKTKNLLSDKQFAMMKKGIVIINTARGSIIDTNALMKALSDGKVAAAGLDVLPEEPVIRDEAELLRSSFQAGYDHQKILADQVLLRLSNVYITPHSAFYTRDAMQRLLDTTIENINASAEGKPQNLVVGKEYAQV
jgi:D-lactate dehydrogenase